VSFQPRTLRRSLSSEAFAPDLAAAAFGKGRQQPPVPDKAARWVGYLLARKPVRASPVGLPPSPENQVGLARLGYPLARNPGRASPVGLPPSPENQVGLARLGYPLAQKPGRATP
jgi:hypothetical protein